MAWVIRKTLKIVFFIVFIIFLIAFALMLGYFYNRDNFHPILPGQYYRSAQLDAAELARIINQYHIRSIISLRQPEPSQTWYEQEIKISNVKHVKHYNLPMHAYILPSSSALRQLTHLLETAPKPVLIHCEGGADRTGLASAMVLLLHNDSLAQAKKQISLRYFVISDKSVGRLVLPYYHHWLEKQDLKSDRQNFLAWVASPQMLQY